MSNRINHLSTPPAYAARILIRKYGFENADTRAGDRYDSAYDGEVRDFYSDVMHAIRKFQTEAKKETP